MSSGEPSKRTGSIPPEKEGDAQAPELPKLPKELEMKVVASPASRQPPRPSTGSEKPPSKPARFVANNAAAVAAEKAAEASRKAAEASLPPAAQSEGSVVSPDSEEAGEGDSTNEVSKVTESTDGESKLPDGEEESWARDGETGREDKKSVKKVRKKEKKDADWESGWKTTARKISGVRVPLLPAIVVTLAFAAFVCVPAYRRGAEDGKRQAEQNVVRGSVNIPPEVTAEVDGALLELRNGDAAAALAVLKRIHEEQPRYPTVSYLVALAATQVGDVELAEKCVAETVAKRERVSDALALQAVLETMKRPTRSKTVLGDPKVRAENNLRQAILADPANAAPRFELATLLRYSNRLDEARKEIRAAQARLTPVDTHTVMEVTLRLMDLQEKGDDGLGPVPATARNLTEAFGGAYLAMRKGEFAQAAKLLEIARQMANADIFLYLINDPLLRRYKDSPEVSKFWQ